MCRIHNSKSTKLHVNYPTQLDWASANNDSLNPHHVMLITQAHVNSPSRHVQINFNTLMMARQICFTLRQLTIVWFGNETKVYNILVSMCSW